MWCKNEKKTELYIVTCAARTRNKNSNRKKYNGRESRYYNVL